MSAVYRVILSCLQLIVSEMQVSNSDKICRIGHMWRAVSSQSSLGRIVWAVGRYVSVRVRSSVSKPVP